MEGVRCEVVAQNGCVGGEGEGLPSSEEVEHISVVFLSTNDLSSSNVQSDPVNKDT